MQFKLHIVKYQFCILINVKLKSATMWDWKWWECIVGSTLNFFTNSASSLNIPISVVFVNHYVFNHKKISIDPTMMNFGEDCLDHLQPKLL